MYLRFTTCLHSGGRCLSRGILQDFHDLIGDFRAEHRIREARDHLRWFNLRLRVPPREVFRSGLGRCWFRPQSAEFLDRMRSWRVLLGQEGIPAREVASRDPGMITYQDPHQIVAVPYAWAWWRR
ncbi:MAG TPA: hypothetical protein VEN81_00970 [Planctomycetota bacterium]|nr:hypothetical protein [Planctomycetota bacterium]